MTLSSDYISIVDDFEKNLKLAWGTMTSNIIPYHISSCLNQFCAPIEKGDPIPRKFINSFDLRNHFKLTPVLYQDTCGSCWAYATSTAFSDRIRIHSNVGNHKLKLCLHNDQVVLKLKKVKARTTVNFAVTPTGRTKIQETVLSRTGEKALKGTYLSPRYFAACDVCEMTTKLNPELTKFFRDNGICTNCCDGGSVQYAHIALVLNGIISEKCDPDPNSFTCTDWSGCPKYRAEYVYSVSGSYDWDNITPQKLKENELKIMTDVYNNGSVTVSMDIYQNFTKGTQGWNNGIYSEKIGSYQGGHAIVLIGWGTKSFQFEKGSNDWVDKYIKKLNPSSYNAAQSGRTYNVNVRYWICRNSWGERWGNKGYFNILRGTNFLGIEEDCWAAMPLSVYPDDRTNPKFTTGKKCTIGISEKDDLDIVRSCSQCTPGRDCFRTVGREFYVCQVDPDSDLDIVSNCPL